MADAGCILQSLTDYVAPDNHIMPIDLGAKGRYVVNNGHLPTLSPIHSQEVVRLAGTSLPMPGDYVSFVTAHYTAQCSA